MQRWRVWLLLTGVRERAMRSNGPTWGAIWLEALAAAGWGTRLKRGLPYVREGVVGSVQVRPGAADADVPDPRGPRRHPRLAVRPLSTPEWRALAATILREPALATAVDSGEWPPAIAPALAAAGIGL